MEFDVVIVGAGHAGAHCAIALPQQGFEGTVAIVGDEPEHPYERPPLSKEYLAGEKSFDRTLIRPIDFWSRAKVSIFLGERVVEIDQRAHEATFASGTRIGYRRLVWAAGGTPRSLGCEGSSLQRIHSIRSRMDVDRLRSELPDVETVAIIGGGYIGLEAAAVLRTLGRKVIVLEALGRVLARVAGEPISRFYEAEHRAHGVKIRTGAIVDQVEGTGGVATGLRLAGDEILPADLVIVAIGINPAVEPLLLAGAKGGNGIEVDEYCRTSLSDIFAIGDCAAHPNRFAGGARIRLESVQNASDQASAVAHCITGSLRTYDAVPWFWSHQYDLKLQTVGLSIGHDQIIVRGDPLARTFSAIYLREGRVIALDCVNAVKDYAQGRRLVVEGAKIDASRLSDPAISLKELVY